MSDHSDRLWIKICGIRDVTTARQVAELGADAIGLNFYRGSPRCVADLETAATIVDSLPTTTLAVGIFVNHTAEEIRRICRVTGLRDIQLHGDEPVELLSEFPDMNVIRALRVSRDAAENLQQELERYRRLDLHPAAWLVESRKEGAYGGTGRTVDWEVLAPCRRAGWPPLILAGGLTPENVSRAIRSVRPYGVDTASGVESEAGIKDLRLVERFIASCRAAEVGTTTDPP